MNTKQFDSIEDEIVHIMTINGSRMTALDIFAEASMAEDERAVANALYRMKQAGKVVVDGKIGVKNLYRVPNGADQNPIKKPDAEPTETAENKPAHRVRHAPHVTIEQLPMPRTQWWLSRDLEVRIEREGFAIILDPEEAIELAEMIVAANN